MKVCSLPVAHIGASTAKGFHHLRDTRIPSRLATSLAGGLVIRTSTNNGGKPWSKSGCRTAHTRNEESTTRNSAKAKGRVTHLVPRLSTEIQNERAGKLRQREIPTREGCTHFGKYAGSSPRLLLGPPALVEQHDVVVLCFLPDVVRVRAAPPHVRQRLHRPVAERAASVRPALFRKVSKLLSREALLRQDAARHHAVHDCLPVRFLRLLHHTDQELVVDAPANALHVSARPRLPATLEIPFDQHLPVQAFDFQAALTDRLR